MKYRTIYLFIFLFSFQSFFCQQNLELTVNVQDSYLNTPIDSAKISIFQNNSLVDSSLSVNGTAAFQFILTDIQEETSTLPKSFELSNNYPNPFNNKTSAEILSGVNEKIRMELYNVLGQQIYKMEFTLLKGNHILELDMNGFPNGVYFLQLHGQNKSLARKLLKLGKSGFSRTPSMRLFASQSSYQNAHSSFKLSGSIKLQLLIERDNYENIFEELTFTKDTTANYNLVRNNNIEIFVADNYQNFIPMLLNVTGQSEHSGYSPLSFIGHSGVYNISGSCDSTENLETEFEVLSTDTSITFHVENLMRNLSVDVYDQYAQEIYIDLSLSNNLLDTSLVTPFTVRLRKGEYQIFGSTDSTTSVDEIIHLESDTTIAYQVENSNSDPSFYDILITVVDTSENNKPVNNKHVRFYPANDISNIDSLLLDSEGKAEINIRSGRYIFKMAEHDTFAGFTEEVFIQQDESFIFGTESKKEINLTITYPDETGVENLLLNISGLQATTNNQGNATILLFPGEYQISANDSRIESINDGISVESNGQEKKLDALEKIIINYSNKTIDEDNQLSENLSSNITVGTAIAQAIFTESDPNIVADGQIITPTQDYNGTANFNVKVVAQHGTEKTSGNYVLTINPMMDLRGWVVDNLDYTKVPGKVRIDGQVYETGPSGKFDIQLAHANLLSELEVWSTKEGDANSFVKTYRNVPFNQDINDAALWVTTYDQLVNGVSDNLKLTPDQFRALVSEGVGDNIKTIDWQNAQNMRIWIDKDFAQRTQPTFFGYDALTGEEQQWIKDVDEQHFLPNIFEDGHKLPIYLANSGEDCPLYEGTNFFRPDYGYFLVTQKKGPGGYQFSSFDHDNDGVIDAALISVGEPTVGNIRQVLEENASVMMINGLITDSELAGKTLFHGQNPTSVLSPGDKKVGRIQENMYVGANASVTPIFEYQLPDGTNVSRFYDHPMSSIDDIIGLPGTSSNERLLSITLLYPNQQGVANAVINVNNNLLTTNENGYASIVLNPGSYNLQVQDERIEPINKNIELQSNLSFVLNAEERITFSYSNQTINEDEVFTDNLANYINVGTSLNAASFNSSTQWLIASNDTLTPNQDENGTAYFTIIAMAENGTIKESQQYTLTVNPMMDLRGWVVDNLDYTKVPGKVRIDGQVYETGPSGKFDIQLAHTNLLSELEVWSTKDGSANSFVKTYRNVSFNQDINDAGLWVTTYDQLVNGVDAALALTPEQFRALVEEGTTGNLDQKIMSIDWHNIQNYKLWIDKDFMKNTYSEVFKFDDITDAEQQHIKDVVEQYFFSHIFEENHKIPIYMASAGEDIPNNQTMPTLRPKDGYFAFLKKTTTAWRFSPFDDGNNKVTAATIQMGEPLLGETSLVIEENASLSMFKPITNMDLQYRTKFHEYGNTSTLAPGDIKTLRIQENMVDGSSSVTPIMDYQLPDGTNVSRFYDHIGKQMDDVVGQ